MKKLAFIIVLSLFVTPFLFGQQLQLTTYVEATHISPKTGMNVKYLDPYMNYEIGVFYQESRMMEAIWMSDEALSNLPRFYEQTFMGLYFSVPMVQEDWFDLKFNIRTGMVNNEAFAITPAIMADWKIAPFLQIGGGIGTRAFRPTFITQLSMKI